jgi:hypothetical protein
MPLRNQSPDDVLQLADARLKSFHILALIVKSVLVPIDSVFNPHHFILPAAHLNARAARNAATAATAYPLFTDAAQRTNPAPCPTPK